MFDTEALRQINYVVEHDATSSTYKYVLLKSVITACQKYDHLITLEDDDALIPIGLIVEQWMFDYMPFVFRKIAQQHSGNVLDKPIESLYREIFEYLHFRDVVSWEYALIQFKIHYESPSKPHALANLFFRLAKKLTDKIVKMPMRYIGQNEYEMFQPQSIKPAGTRLHKDEMFNTGLLVSKLGSFKISLQHYQIYRYLGQTLYGTSTIIEKWKAKTDALNADTFQHETIIDRLSIDLLTARNTNPIRALLKGEQECVWTGKTLKSDYDVDHVLPFSVWFNNDLWNMLPSDRTVNQRSKKDKIPSPKLIESRADAIKRYWGLYEKEWPNLFQNQIDISLCGQSAQAVNHLDFAIEALCKKAHYLIVDRGHEVFSL